MKKTNKKGFTLAELLIVIAIIAILIAIAIPAFGGALNNAKIQTDHANMRSAYAMAQSATLQGVLYLDDTNEVKVSAMTTKYFFMQDGTLSTSKDGAYQCKGSPKAASGSTSDDCLASIPCKAPNTHVVNAYIWLEVDSANPGRVVVKVGTPT